MLRFYFLSGEFLVDDSVSLLSFLSALFAEIGGTFVGAMFALRLYKKELSDKKGIEIRAIQKFNIDKLHYLSSLIRGSMNFCQSQINSCSAIINGLTDDIFTILDMNLVASDDLLRVVEKLDRESVYHAYRAKIEDQRITLLFTDLDTLNRLREQLELTWKQFVTFEHQNKRLVFEQVQKSSTLISTIFHDQTIHETLRRQMRQILQSQFPESNNQSSDYLGLRMNYFERIIAIANPDTIPSNLAIEELFKSCMSGAQIVDAISISNSNFRMELVKIEIRLGSLALRIRESWGPIQALLERTPADVV